MNLMDAMTTSMTLDSRCSQIWLENFRKWQRSPEISRQSHRCPYLPPFAQKSPEPVFIGHQTPFRCKTRPSWREKVLGSSSFLSPILASESDLILLVLPRDSTFPTSSPVPMSTSSSSSARLPNLAVMSPEAHAFDPSHPAHRACPSFCY